MVDGYRGDDMEYRRLVEVVETLLQYARRHVLLLTVHVQVLEYEPQRRVYSKNASDERVERERGRRVSHQRQL